MQMCSILIESGRKILQLKLNLEGLSELGPASAEVPLLWHGDRLRHSTILIILPGCDQRRARHNEKVNVMQNKVMPQPQTWHI